MSGPSGVASAVALALLAAAPVAAQDIESSITHLQENLGKAAAAKPSQAALTSRINQDVFALQVVAPQMRAADAADYARSMEHNSWLLDRARTASDAEAAAILADVAADLDVKRQASSGMGASSSFTGKIKVHVRTLRNGQPAPGYRITLSPVRWALAEPMFRLPQLTPHASGNVPPGRYLISAIEGNAIKASETFGLGLGAEDEMTIDLPVR